MKNNLPKYEILIAVLLTTLIIASRLTAHIWNMTAVGGIALFAGAFFTRRYMSFAVLAFGMIISDLIIGFHDLMWVVYFSYALIALLGFLLSLNSSRVKIISLALVGGILFFLITNFAVWWQGAMYPQTFSGLMESYRMGLPFFRSQILADIVSAFILFELAKLPATIGFAVRLKL